MTPILTPRLCIRPLTRWDGEAVYALVSRPEVARYMRFSQCRSPAQANKILEEYLEPENRSFALEERETGRFVGIFSLKRDVEKEGVFSLSTFTHPACWNKGYAGETLARMMVYAREELFAKILSAYVVERNIGSRRVLEKCGFRVERSLQFEDLSGSLLVYQLCLV